jgi:hypothetical protein
LEVPSSVARTVSSVLNANIGFLEKGLDQRISLERKAQIDVVSDFLKMGSEFKT